MKRVSDSYHYFLDCNLFVSMKAKTNFLRCIGYLSFTKDHTEKDLLQILALVLPLNFLNY